MAISSGRESPRLRARPHRHRFAILVVGKRRGSKGGSLESLKSPLFILVSVQTIIVAALFFKMSDVEKRLVAVGAAPAPVAEAGPVAAAVSSGAAGLTESDIRAILRDELGALKASNSVAPAPAAAPPRTAQTDRAFLDVQQETRRLVAKGFASEAELATLEIRIAELPPEQRRLALSAISRAVSNGTLKARF